jgi:hypothetical protein
MSFQDFLLDAWRRDKSPLKIEMTHGDLSSEVKTTDVDGREVLWFFNYEGELLQK